MGQLVMDMTVENVANYKRKIFLNEVADLLLIGSVGEFYLGVQRAADYFTRDIFVAFKIALEKRKVLVHWVQIPKNFGAPRIDLLFPV